MFIEDGTVTNSRVEKESYDNFNILNEQPQYKPNTMSDSDCSEDFSISIYVNYL